MKSGPYLIRGTSTLCLLYLKKVLHDFLLPLHSRPSPKSQKPSDPHVAFVPPFPRDWSSCLHLFCSSPENCRLDLFSPDTSLGCTDEHPGDVFTSYRAPWLTRTGHAVLFLIHPVLGFLFSVLCLLLWVTPISC